MYQDLKMANAIRRIQCAFKEVQCPETIADSALQMDEVEIFATKRWSTWQEIPKRLILENPWPIIFFNAQAFRFFLPAYMIVTLENIDSGQDVIEYTLRSLLPERKNGFMMPRYQFEIFNDKEIRAILDFLYRMKNFTKQKWKKQLEFNRTMKSLNWSINYWSVHAGK